MKNLSFILNVVMAIAVIILFYFHFAANNIPVTLPEKQAFVSGSFPGLMNDSALRETAYINTNTLFENFLFVKDIRDNLAAEKLKSESHYNDELKKLEKEYTEFQEKARFMSQQDGEAKQMELAEKEQVLMKLEKDLANKLSDIELEKNKEIQKIVFAYLEKVNKEKNYTYIFGYNGMGNVLYANSRFDITREIVNGLNNEYMEKKENVKASR